MTEQVPVPKTIVNVAPALEQESPLEKVTALPEPPPVAATVNCVLKTAVEGACVVTVIVWSAFVTVAVWVCCGAAGYCALPAWSAATTQLPAWFAVSTLPVRLHGPARTL